MTEKLKADIFDIIHKQELMRIEYAELEKFKQAKLRELEAKEKANGNIPNRNS